MVNKKKKENSNLKKVLSQNHRSVKVEAKQAETAEDGGQSLRKQTQERWRVHDQNACGKA